MRTTPSRVPWGFSGCLPRGPVLVSGVRGDCRPGSPCPGREQSVSLGGEPARWPHCCFLAGARLSCSVRADGRLGFTSRCATRAQMRGATRGVGGREWGGTTVSSLSLSGARARTPTSIFGLSAFGLFAGKAHERFRVPRFHLVNFLQPPSCGQVCGARVPGRAVGGGPCPPCFLFHFGGR